MDENCACGERLSRLVGAERKFDFGEFKLNIDDGYYEPTMCRECAIEHSLAEIGKVITLDEQSRPVVNWRSYLQFEKKSFINEALGDLKIIDGINGWMVMSASGKCVNPKNGATIFFFIAPKDAKDFGLIQEEVCKIIHRAEYLRKTQPGLKVDWRLLEKLIKG